MTDPRARADFETLDPIDGLQFQLSITNQRLINLQNQIDATVAELADLRATRSGMVARRARLERLIAAAEASDASA